MQQGEQSVPLAAPAAIPLHGELGRYRWLGSSRQSCASCSDPSPPELLLLDASLAWPPPASPCPRKEHFSFPAELSCSQSLLFTPCLLSMPSRATGMPFSAHLDSCKDSISTPRTAEIVLLVQSLTAQRRAGHGGGLRRKRYQKFL